MAGSSVGSDHQSLESVIEQLNQMMRREDSEHAPEAFSQLFRSQLLHEALAMSGRMRALQALPSASPTLNYAFMSPARRVANARNYYSNLAFGSLLRRSAEGPARQVILRMQPKRREELVQGMREKAPQGYQRYVEDYFRALASVRIKDEG